MPSLNIIGCGKVGKTLGFLLVQADCYHIQDILCRSLASSLDCIAFLGEGQAVASFQALRPADAILIAVNDDQLQTVACSLSANENLSTSGLAFHCSGAYSHEILASLKIAGMKVASIHPIKSFCDPSTDIEQFKGTYCTLEGDDLACEVLEQNLTTIGANVLHISPNHKIIYHIATIFSSNYFITLLDISLQLLEQIHIPREQGIAMLEPLILGAFHQVKNKGTSKALTGPISRGESELIKKQLQALAMIDTDMTATYKVLGRLTVALAMKDNRLSLEKIEKLKSLLK